MSFLIILVLFVLGGAGAGCYAFFQLNRVHARLRELDSRLDALEIKREQGDSGSDAIERSITEEHKQTAEVVVLLYGNIPVRANGLIDKAINHLGKAAGTRCVAWLRFPNNILIGFIV